jgi:hypothetical protein
MKKLICIIASLAVLSASCSKDCDALREEIERDYIESMQNSGGNPASVQHLKNERDKKLAELDC